MVNHMPLDGGNLSLTRIYATPDGETHMQEVTIVAGAAIPSAAVIASSYKPSTVDWHTAPRKQFIAHMAGVVETSVSDGTQRRFGPGDLVYVEDIVGKGHLTKMIEPVTNLFIRVPDDFDVLAWAKGG